MWTSDGALFCPLHPPNVSQCDLTEQTQSYSPVLKLVMTPHGLRDTDQIPTLADLEQLL